MCVLPDRRILREVGLIQGTQSELLFKLKQIKNPSMSRIKMDELPVMMEILRQRLFISHDQKKQQSITSEYTIISKRRDLTNIIILQDKFLPNLVVRDNDGSILPVMTTNDTQQLLKYFLKQESGEIQQKTRHIYDKIVSNELHVIWIKIPETKSLTENEIRIITLSYSPHQPDKLGSILKMKIKKQPYPLYYTLFTPDEFDFDKTRYGIIKNNQMNYSQSQPDHVEKFKTHDSKLLRISSDIEDGFEIKYSFKPKSTSIAPIRIGAIALLSLPTVFLVLRYLVFWNDPPDLDIFAKHVEIGLFVIGGSLILPQLTSNPLIRTKYKWWYLTSIILGSLLLL